MGEAGLTELAGVVGAAGAALVLLAGRRAVLVAGFAAIATAEVLLADPGRISPTLAAAGAAGIVALAAAGAVFVRYPALVVPALLIAAPFRLPFDFDRDYRFLFSLAEGGKLGRLVPLYAVLAAAVAACLWRALRGVEVAPIARLPALPAAAFFALASLSLLWSRDLSSGANLLAFFLLPFAALVAVVGRAELAPRLPKVLAWISIGLASLFAAIGLWQEATKDLFFFSPQLEVANAYSPFFRVTSLFTDPSLYGRHVVLGFAVLLVLIWTERINLFFGTAIGVLLFAGLYFSYSQTSMATLAVVAFVVTLVAGDRIARRAVVAATAVVAVAAAGFLLVGAKGHSIQDVTSGRWTRVERTADVVREAPLLGVGLGAQPKASQDLTEKKGARTARFVSHTTPLTVAAELGIIGLAVYGLLLAATIRTILLLRRRDFPLALSLGAVLLALFVHALAYSGFFEDPITWLALGIAAAYLVAPAVARAPAAERAAGDRAPTGQPIPVR
ncbi:MAG TPA: O-antigen ligase family protein [Gaiellaceae bacterium]|nr:O-antigen ligase family protein [Gaiellaceae bacterium]